ncbi:MAG: Hpt domain-containing protein [Campylobacterales bacterium]|nr:Hpt domain-containing protein [Campylobacterales bacterium]
MLIYNYKKEFVGMDEQDLKILGFTDLSALLAQTGDFADFFVREPGFVHNFKHVHWIDFVECADDSESQKALICVNSKTFRCNLTIKTLYLNDKPSSKAYMVTLQNLRELGNQEDISSSSTFNKTAPSMQNKPPNIIKNSDEIQEIATPKTTELVVEKIPDIEIPKVPEALKILEDTTLNKIVIEPIPIQVLPEKASVSNEINVGDSTHIDEFIYNEEIKEKNKEVVQKIEDEFNGDYYYDPKIASSELGLPIDLIEEFIEDFIVQTKEFKDELYNALENGDIAHIKILSHKLKGVASNLRIEDALDVLTTINTSDNLTEIKLNLEIFYKIIAKLSGEEVYLHKKSAPPKKEEPIKAEPTKEIKIQESNDDDFVVAFKDDTPLEAKPSHEIKVEDDDLIISFKEDVIEAPKIEDSPKIEQIFEETAKEITYNKKQAAAEIGLDDETFCELFEDYILESKVLCNSIHSAIESNNLSMCKVNAIKLKGMSDNMRISDLTAELETLMNTDNMEVAKKTIMQIDTLLSQISKTES